MYPLRLTLVRLYRVVYFGYIDHESPRPFYGMAMDKFGILWAFYDTLFKTSPSINSFEAFYNFVQNQAHRKQAK